MPLANLVERVVPGMKREEVRCLCMRAYVCVYERERELFGRRDFFLPAPSSPSLLGMGSGATDGERREDTKEEACHCQDPKEEGWRGWQSCLAPSQFPAEDGQVLLPGLYMSLCGHGRGGKGLLAELRSEMGRAPFCRSHLDCTLTSEVSDFVLGAFLSFPSLHSTPLSSLPPPGSYCLAPNQLDAATLGSAALSREHCFRPWHCGKPKAARHAHDRHLAAVREGRRALACQALGGALCWGVASEGIPISGAESMPSSLPQLLLPPSWTATSHLPSQPPRQGFGWCHTQDLSSSSKGSWSTEGQGHR